MFQSRIETVQLWSIWTGSYHTWHNAYGVDVAGGLILTTPGYFTGETLSEDFIPSHGQRWLATHEDPGKYRVFRLLKSGWREYGAIFRTSVDSSVHLN